MSKDNKHNLILLIGALCLCTLVLCGFVLVPIIASEFAEQAPEQQETRKTIERVLDKNLSRTPLPSNFTITFRKTNGLWLSNVDATDKDMALLAQNEDVEKLKVVSAMTGKGLESLEKEPIWDLEVRKHYFDRASFEAISRMKNLKRLVINR
ncbi:MAG: hypothetical protein K2Z81_24410, partial [Cyanobacteria bacterium]|nr:hypothetical protein [Cyanobacteriota bacterium]